MKKPTKQQKLHHYQLLAALVLAASLSSSIAFFWYKYPLETTTFQFHANPDRRFHLHNCSYEPPPLPPPTTTASVESKWESGPYHNWDLFHADFEEMMQHLKIFVYPEVFNKSSPFANIFLPLQNPFHHPKLGNYMSEHMFKVCLLRSSLLTPIPEQAHFFFLPFSINNLRNDPRFHSEASISKFVTQYTTTISHHFRFWNASAGADHFYVCCHSIGRKAASRYRPLYNNAIQLTCSSSYFQRFFVSHKDVGLPQVWPRPPQSAIALNPPHAR